MLTETEMTEVGVQCAIIASAIGAVNLEHLKQLIGEVQTLTNAPFHQKTIDLAKLVLFMANELKEHKLI